VFKCGGNLFLFGALITTLIRPEWIRGVEILVGDRGMRERIKKA